MAPDDLWYQLRSLDCARSARVALENLGDLDPSLGAVITGVGTYLGSFLSEEKAAAILRTTGQQEYTPPAQAAADAQVARGQ
jgi:hypothetical protein